MTIQLSKIQLYSTFRVTHTTGGEEDWDYQIDLFKTSSKAGVTQAFNDLHFLSLLNGNVFGTNIAVDVPIQNIFIAVGDDSSVNFGSTIPAVLCPIKSGTFSVTDGTHTLTDDGTGALVGTGGSGTVNIATGVWSVTFTAAPTATEQILVSLTKGSVAADAIETGFSFILTTDLNAAVDNTAWGSLIPLTVAPAKISRIATGTAYMYTVEMNATYTGSDTAPVTGVGIGFKLAEGTTYDETGDTLIIAKSIAPKSNTLYPSNELVLSNLSTITVTYTVSVSM